MQVSTKFTIAIHILAAASYFGKDYKRVPGRQHRLQPGDRPEPYEAAEGSRADFCPPGAGRH